MIGFIFVVMLACAFLYLRSAYRTTPERSMNALPVRVAAAVIACLTVILGVVWACSS
jgi:hypothetical protein